MSNAELIYLAVVILAGIPAARWNWTAAMLVLIYIFMQVSYYWLGLIYPSTVSFLADMTVIALIYCKGPACDLWPYTDWKAQLAACWLERTRWDRLILALFPIGWAFYALASNPWWPLYYISLAQLLAASYEALETFYTTRTAKRAPVSESSGLEFTNGWREWNYG